MITCRVIAMAFFLAVFLLATMWRRKAEHDRRLRVERERFVAYVDRYGPEWERIR